MSDYSLYRFIDIHGVRCMNESEAGSGRNCIKPRRSYAPPYLLSHDDDPEMVLFVPFTEVVSIRSFALAGNVTHVKLFVNRDDVDFSSGPAAQEVDIITMDVDYAVKPSKFASVSSVTLIVDAIDTPSRVSFLGFKGSSTGIKHRSVPIAVYESRAGFSSLQPATHLPTF